MFGTKDVRQKLIAARDLLSESSTTREKLSAITTLLAGIHPRTDALLFECNRHLSTIGKIQRGDVIHLSADMMPENTEEEKKRKKALIFFIKNWNDLKSEVARIQSELEGQGSGAATAQAGMWGRIFAFSKGPLVLVGVVAVGLTALSAIAISVTIVNDGCSTIHTEGSIPLSIPGLSLPQEPIESGASGVAKLPPLTVTIDGTSRGTLSFKALGLNMSIALSSAIKEVSLDGTSLLNTKTEVHLGEQKEHVLLLRCR